MGPYGIQLQGFDGVSLNAPSSGLQSKCLEESFVSTIWQVNPVKSDWLLSMPGRCCYQFGVNVLGVLLKIGISRRSEMLEMPGSVACFENHDVGELLS